jgi:MFS superfamily sulfate permease-like transporter
VFSNADFVRTRVRALAAGVPHLRLVVLDGRTTPSIDVTAVQMLTELRADLARDGADLALADDVGQVRDVLRRAAPSVGSGPDDGEPALHATVDDAIASLAWTQLPATVAGTGPSADPGPGA